MSEQVPPVDCFSGVVMEWDGLPKTLVMDPAYRPSAGVVLGRGDVFVAYGWPYLLVRRQEVLLPVWTYDEFRREHTGWAALDFLWRKGAMFPRADVGGRRATSGAWDERYFKEIDLAAQVQALAYADQALTTSLGRIETAVWFADTVATVTPLADDDERGSVWLRRATDCLLVPPEMRDDLEVALRA